MEVSMDYAGFWRRFGAWIIDAIILGVLNWILVIISPGTATWLGSVVGIIYVIGFWTWRGQTIGKMAVGVKIIKIDGSSIGIGWAILRYIGYIISTIIIFIGYLMIAWDGKKQGLHDKIASTVVIRTG